MESTGRRVYTLLEIAPEYWLLNAAHAQFPGSQDGSDAAWIVAPDERTASRRMSDTLSALSASS
jgi:hypothetical protein